jgi:hypothetical protein
MGGICIIRWALFALDLFSHISLKALDIRQSKPFLHEKDELVLAHILVQIPPTEWLMSNFDTGGEVDFRRDVLTFLSTKRWTVFPTEKEKCLVLVGSFPTF